MLKLFLVCVICSYTFLSLAIAQDGSFSINSDILQESRQIIVHLPEQYDPKKAGGYGVIYMLDGGNDDRLTAQTAQKYYNSNLMPEVIVVATRHKQRGYDFTPPYKTVDRMTPVTHGNGANFLKFIETELISEINEKYNTSDHRVFMGNSWGGFFVAYVLSQSPDLFDAFFLYSPALGSDTDRLFLDLKTTFKKDVKFPRFVYVSVGTEEQEGFKESYRSLTLLFQEYMPDSIKLYFETTINAGHMENPEVSIPKALKYYFNYLK